jgi:hypothetical protein
VAGLAPLCAAEIPSGSVPRPSYWARAIGPYHTRALSRLPEPLAPSGAYRPGWFETLGLVARALPPAWTRLPLPRDAYLPSVCDRCRPLAPRDTGSLCVVRPDPPQRYDDPTRRWFRPAKGRPHNISRPSQPERHGVSVQSFWRPPSAHRRSETDEETDGIPASSRACPPYDLLKECGLPLARGALSTLTLAQ